MKHRFTPTHPYQVALEAAQKELELLIGEQAILRHHIKVVKRGISVLEAKVKELEERPLEQAS